MLERRKLRSLCICALMLIRITVTTSGASGGMQTPPGRGAVHASATTIVVTSTADSGPGTLRRAMEQARSGDIITFDAAIFPPTAPATISITSILPTMWSGNVTIDASDAGVILDGSSLSGEWEPGFQIVGSHGNRIRGLQISNFSGRAIDISGDSRHNVIGGDRDVGTGPYGQGNLLSSNGNGIVIALEAATQNSIAGNLIGTDGAGTSGLGNVRGISICEGARGNIIGPDNVIAHNLGTGIVVEHWNSLHNTITQNSIHDNGSRGISLREGGNSELSAPVILNFDLAAGTGYGFACPNCTVEIFSDSADEGEVYEGQAIANSKGVFSFTKGVSFTGPHLTATATDPEGNTSEFSIPTSGTHKTLSLQQGNSSPLSPLSPKPSQLLRDNHIGGWFGDHGEYQDTDFVYRNGFKRIRIGSLAGEGQYWSTIINSETLSDEVDQTITEYADNGVEIGLILASGAGLHAWNTLFQSEEEIEQYLEYVRFAVAHFKGRIRRYEIWNEPIFIAVDDYANLVERAMEVIRPIDPDAKIIIGAIHGEWTNGYPGYGEYQRNSVDIGYLRELLLSGVVRLADGISWHPLYDNIPSDPYYQDYPQMVAGIKQLASSQGFQGEYFADEIMWITVDEPDAYSAPVSHHIAAKYFARAITEHRGLDINVTVNTFFQVPYVAPIRHVCNTLAGAEPTDTTVSVTGDATNAVVRHYEFALPTGDRLVALWTNGVAVDDDPGTSATLTIPGCTVKRVIGIDVLNGFKQRMMTSEENGNLVIRNVLVKDYPTILRLIPIKNIFLPVVMKVRSGVPDATPTVVLSPSPTPTPSPTRSIPSPTPTVTPSPSPTASLARTIVVTSAADSGPGSLREAMWRALNGDTITFDPAVFPPGAPATISITSELPPMWQGNVTIDGSNAGVILDGSSLPGEWPAGLQVASDGNTIRGLQISSFSGRAIDIGGYTQRNIIGGDRNIGTGPHGQGNLLSNNGNGIVMHQEGSSLNVVTGNLIGTDGAGTSGLGNSCGIWICEGASGNIIGPANVIAHNSGSGILVQHTGSLHNTITQNSIHDNGSRGISLWEGGNSELSAPVILDFDLAAGTVSGSACPNCAVEIFSDSADEGEVYEGQAIADSNGVFDFAKGVSFTGPHLTATATDPDGNTSGFSSPTSGPSSSPRPTVGPSPSSRATPSSTPSPWPTPAWTATTTLTTTPTRTAQPRV